MKTVMITRRRDPLEGQTVGVLGRLRRHGAATLLVVLPDGSKRMIPASWTDLETGSDSGNGSDGIDGAADLAEVDEAEEGTALGSVADLLAACALVSAFSARAGGAKEQAAQKSPWEEESCAACPAQSDAGGVPGATGDDISPAARATDHGRGGAAGRPDRQGRGGKGGSRS